jgi:Trypsin
MTMMKLILLTRIVGGDFVTDPDLFPYFAFPAGEDLCGATLIYTDILLTAAHCSGAFVSRGALIGGTKLDSSQSQYVQVDREYPHPDYNKGTEENDIMLVRLTAFITTPTVRLNFDNQIPYDNDIVTTIGFGFTSVNGTFSKQLKQASISVVPFDQCNSYFEDLNNETTICAGALDGSNDSCRGDSGGPLFISSSTATSNDIKLQIGIVSFGDGCGTPGIAAVYTRISAYEKWIQQGICDLSDNPPIDCTFTPTTSPPTVTPLPTYFMPPLGSQIPISPSNEPSHRPSIQTSDIPTASSAPEVIVRPVPEEKSPRASQPVRRPTGSGTMTITTTTTSSTGPRKPQNTHSNNIMQSVKMDKKSRKGSMKRSRKFKLSSNTYADTSIEDDRQEEDDNKRKIHRPRNNKKATLMHRKSHLEYSNRSETMGKIRIPVQVKWRMESSPTNISKSSRIGTASSTATGKLY